MSAEKRRQAILLGVLVVVVTAYFWYGGVGFGGGEEGPGAMPPIDARGLESALKDVATVNPGLFGVVRPDSVADRNLFQYGEKKPPPPDPAELERQRLAAQASLAAQDAEARRLKDIERMQALAEERARQEAERRKNDPPPPPEPEVPVRVGKAPPPPIDFKFIGVLGPARNKIAVLLDGNNPPILAKRGEIVLEKFRVLEIGVEWADVGYVDPDYKASKKRIHLGP